MKWNEVSGVFFRLEAALGKKIIRPEQTRYADKTPERPNRMKTVKCQHLHVNTGIKCEMGGTILCITVKKHDLKVKTNGNMKVS